MKIEGIRFGPGERLLQCAIAGLDWKSSYSIGNAFFAARRAVPERVRRAAFESYIADPMDGATPLGIVDRSEEHTSELQSLMRISYAVFCLKNKKTHHDTSNPL